MHLLIDFSPSQQTLWDEPHQTAQGSKRLSRLSSVHSSVFTHICLCQPRMKDAGVQTSKDADTRSVCFIT